MRRTLSAALLLLALAGAGCAQKQKVIKTYNRIDIYANTILGLAEAQGYVAE